MAFPVPYVLIAAFAFWLLLAGLQRLLRSRADGPRIGPGDEHVEILTPDGARLVARAYTTATSEVHRLPRERT
jgi:hypothetical protein